MFFFRKKPNSTKVTSSIDNDNFKVISENLYKQNLELAVRNKTLSLLRQLYQISILTLEPEALGAKVVQTIRDSLEFELVEIFLFDERQNVLSPLSSAPSERLQKVSKETKQNLSCTISNISENKFFSTILKTQSVNYTYGVVDVWGNCVSDEALTQIANDSHIKTTAGYPLTINGRIVGILIFCFNRSYDNLTDFEKDSIVSFVDVVAVALDKSLLYKELTVTNNKLTAANARLKELDQLKSEFVSLATHQIRSPLTAIKGYISLIKDGDYGPVPPEIVKPLDIVFDSTNNLVTIVGDFLDVSRIEQGRMKYDISDFDVEKLAEEVITEYRPNVEKRGLKLNYSFEQGKNYMVNADRGKIKQVIGNIIDNSIKYTPQGNIDVSVGVKEDKILIKVADTGVGIPKGTMPKLFQKFTRAENANEANILGTGLGLYVAKNMVESMHGQIWAESEGERKGAQFYIELIPKM